MKPASTSHPIGWRSRYTRYSASTASTTTPTIRAVVAKIAAEREPGAGPSSAAAGCGMSLIAALFDAAHSSPPTARPSAAAASPVNSGSARLSHIRAGSPSSPRRWDLSIHVENVAEQRRARQEQCVAGHVGAREDAEREGAAQVHGE